jgi:DNA-binding NarL/FixJ family response regulator
MRRRRRPRPGREGGRAEINQERLPSTIRHLERARQIAGSAGQSHVVSFLHMMLGTVNLLLGHLDRATAYFDDELDAAYLTGSTAQRSIALRDQCWLAITAGDTEEAVRLLLEAGDRIMAARAHLSAATAFGTLGDLDSARRHFTEAGTLYEACGAPAQVALVLRERRRMDARQPRPAPAMTAGGQPADALTPRERQVAEPAAQGLTNRQIGETLHLSPRTVNIHLTRTFAKLGVSRRAAVAGRLGRPS